MTDGIIQEVINPLIKWHASHNDTDFANTLKLIRNELIEKIKHSYLGYSSETTKRQLIGDNQE